MESKRSAPQPAAATLVVDRLRAQGGGFRSKVVIVSGCIVMAVAVLAILAHVFWPFTEAAVRSDLASASSSNVRFGSFHDRYFPPGCVAENVTFQERSGGAPLVSIRRLTIRASLVGLLTHHVSLIKAEGLHGEIAPRGVGLDASGKEPAIDTLIADDAVLEVPRHTPQAGLQFRFHKLSIRNLNARSGVVSFAAVLDVPEPPGLASISGQFGPWKTSDPKSTSISGKYSLQNADLAVFHSIAGIVSSTGKFHGNLEQIQVDGATHSPEFMVTRTHHSLPLDVNFQAVVETHAGDVVLPHFEAKFGRDEISGSGSIARRSNGRRSTMLDLNCNRGRIEDTFYPFITSARSSLTGDVSFHMHIELASGHESFLRKLSLKSQFQIQNSRFTNSRTEESVSKVSAPPNQDKTQSLAELQGSVSVGNGVARFQPLGIRDDGAAAVFTGSYDLENQRIDLHGRLKTAASLTKTTHGVKAVFAKVIEAFYKKKPHVTVVPVHIGGTYSHPNFGLDL